MDIVARQPSQSYDGVGYKKLKDQYLDYLDSKSDEIEEQQEARRYQHGDQYTPKQIKALNRRKQPIVTYNKIASKINAIVGLIERQRTDPRAFPRTPKHEEGAEIATATLRFALDSNQWPMASSEVGQHGAVDGLGGIELTLEQDQPDDDIEVGFEVFDPSGFFYDPRSTRHDFSDARFMGLGKWSDVEAAIEMFPDKEREIRESVNSGDELTSNPDSDHKWFMRSEGQTKIRIVDHWFIKNGEWHWCIYTGSTKLDEGVSPFYNDKGRTISKFIVFSANVDHDGDRYGFVRNMRSSQDEINQRRSKALHLLNTRRMIVERGQSTNIEQLRREAARPDGVLLHEPGTTPPRFDDAATSQELQGQLAFLGDAKSEIDNFGFNPSLMGSGVQGMSGRAIQLQQQAGIAELGPYLLGFRSWKLRVYRAVWNAIQRYWSSERWIRVTDDDNLAQFFAVNQLGIDPRTGLPTIINALGSLDVDIILDESPDTVNMMEDTYETLKAMAAQGAQVPPEVIIEMSPLHGSKKKKILDMIEASKQQQAQAAQAAMQIEAQGKQADANLKAAQTQKTQAEAMNKRADTRKKLVESEKIKSEIPPPVIQPPAQYMQI